MKETLRKVIRFILLIIIIVCLAILGKRGYDYWTNIQNNKHIAGLIKESQDEIGDGDENLSPEEKLKKLEKQNLYLLKKFKEENSDVVAVIEIPGTPIKYPLLHADDNSFYLRKGLNKEYDLAGSIFMDTNNNTDLNDDNTVIYGHHLELESMFTPLDQYRKQDFAEKHTTMYITTEEGLREYEIFSAYGIPSDYDYRTLEFMYDADKIPYFEKLQNNSEVDLGSREFTEDDTIVTLSTCQYDYDDQRLAVHAVRIK
ncbi:class B sortase [Anaerococcus prevotii]|uniref:Sortase, SrtB family n=1 Tax=Anaerococcus prevotii ACS-065-V-Col13 TaxID=879305 RepID=F0GVE7_9FIRM|nr:class B sortase [Anaerococcus prevotii]EGC82204.1 sortase, SrtB family [Anaerococcus prevotii ACS-065-V-Col13]